MGLRTWQRHRRATSLHPASGEREGRSAGRLEGGSARHHLITHVQQTAVLAGATRTRRRSYQVGDTVFASLTRASGAFVLILLGSLILSLLIGGFAAFA